MLTAFFIAVTIFVGLMFLDASFLPALRLYVVYWENTALGVVLVLLLQFAYQFPAEFESRKLERYAALAVSLGYALYEAQYTIYRYKLLIVDASVDYRPYWADVALAVIFLWVPIAFLRQSIAADTRAIVWWRKLWKPDGEGARAAREFIWIYTIPCALALINLLRAYSVVTTTFFNIALSSGILMTLWLFASRYIHFIPGGTSMLSKLSAITLTLFLAIIGTIGWLVTPAYARTYHPALTDHQSLRFTPNLSGGYDVAPIDFYFEPDLGDRLPVTYMDEARSTKIDFTFPFYGKTYTEIYAANSGAIVLGEPYFQPNLQTCCLRFPAIFPLLMDLDTTQGGGLNARKAGDRLILTWDHVPALYQPASVFTFQLVLHQNGIFDITYNGLPAPIAFDPDATPSANPWLRGLSNGTGEVTAKELVSDLSQPYHAEASGFYQDFYMGFRTYLHQFILPLGWLVLIISLLLLIILPALIRSSMTKPLNDLLEGVRQMDAGNLKLKIPVRSRDEIGFLTGAFNKMTFTLNEMVTGLERRVAERTTELTAANEQLQVEMTTREQAQTQLIERQRDLSALEERERMSRDLHDGLGQTIGYISVQTQAIQTMLENGDERMARQNLTRLAQVAQDTHAEIRQYILGLRTPQAQSNLVAVLGAFIAEYRASSGIQVTFSLPEQSLPALPPVMETQVIHIVQESLINVRKHAAVNKVEVLFSLNERSLQVMVSDVGLGFVPRQRFTDEFKHFGLDMMRERAEMIGGRLEIRSAPGSGTKVILFVPLLTESAKESTDEGYRGLRILLVDDSALFADGLKTLLTARGLVVVGIARDGIEAVEQNCLLHPDVIIMDIMMPNLNGIEAVRAIKSEFPAAKILMLTSSEQEEHLIEAVKSGASGFLLKNMDANELCRQLARVVRGEIILPSHIAARVITRIEQDASSPDLSERQQQVLDMVASGMSYKEIGVALHLSEQTIKYHMGQILERLHVETRMQAVAYANQSRGKK